jgi:hypothetical protein
MVCAFVLVLCFSTSSFAQGTAGKISGQVIDKSTKEPLPAASIRIEGTPMGSMADEKGNYFILNIPPGTYSLLVNVIGYQPIRIQGVRVQQDFTTYQNFELESTVLEAAEAVTVTAERPLVEKSLTSSRTIIDPAEIKALPVVNIAELVLTTAGSIGGNLRGGRAEDQQTTLDGSTVTSQRGNTGQAFTVNPFMIQELEVKTGTFNAEYVNALSGLTSVVTKDGGSQFSGNLEFRTLGQKGLNWAAPPDLDLVDKFRSGEEDGASLRDLINTAINLTNQFNNDPARQQDGLRLQNPFDVLDTSDANPANWTARYSRENYYWDYDRIIPESEGVGFSYLSQGLGVARVASGRIDRTYNPDKYNEFQRNNRTEKRPTQLDWGMGGPIGGRVNWFASGRFAEDWGRDPNVYNRTINFFGKMTYRPTNSTKLAFSGLIEDNGFFSGKGQRTAAYNWKYIMEGLNPSFNGRLHLNTSFTHTLSPKTFYEFRISHLREYNESYNPRYGKGPLPNRATNLAGIGYNPLLTTSPTGYVLAGDNAYADILSGNYTDIRPFKTDLSYSITSQVTLNHQFKAGAGVTMNDYHESRRGIASGNAVALFAATNADPTANVERLSGWEYHVYPTEYYLYAQDRVEYGGLIVNAGLRLDIFDPKSNYINPFRPRSGASAANDDPQYLTLHPSIKTGLAPRLGISHPITDRAALHYSYGVFNQRATLANLYDGLVQSYPFQRNHGNPDLPYQKATNYEMGVQAEVYPGYHLDVTGYFRDVDDLPRLWLTPPEANFIGGAQREISIFLPTYGQDSRGFEVSFRRAMANRFSIRGNYTVAFTTDLNIPPGVEETITNSAVFTSRTPKPATFQRQFNGFDRRHRIVTNILIELPYGVSASFLTKAQSGNEYKSKNESAADPLGLLGKARRSPWTTTTDMYAQKQFNLGRSTRIGVFTQINNLFDRYNIYNVGSSPAAERFLRRGDPVGFVGGPIGGLGTQGSTPRDIWVGFNLSW